MEVQQDYLSQEESMIYHAIATKLNQDLGININQPIGKLQDALTHEGIYNHTYFCIPNDGDYKIIYMKSQNIFDLGFVITEEDVILHFLRVDPYCRKQGLGKRIVEGFKWLSTLQGKNLKLNVEPIDFRIQIEMENNIDIGTKIGKKVLKKYNKEWTQQVNDLIRFYKKCGLTKVNQPVSMGITMENRLTSDQLSAIAQLKNMLS